jgi:ABC-type glycerol-3-phosphate transport system permease component
VFRGFLHLVVAVMLITMVVPLVWMISTSLKTYADALTFPPRLIPKPIYWQSYWEVLSTTGLPRSIFNSVIYAGLGTLASVFVSALTGFAFAKYAFPGKGITFALILATLMVPFHVTLIPIFLLLKKFHWVNTYFGLIVPGIASPFGIFLIRQFGAGVPNDLFESARMDGCREMRIFAQIFVPLCMPAISTLVVLDFLARWNDLFWPLIVISTPSMRTIQLALTLISRSLYDIFWNQLTAGMTLALIPVMTLYILFQRYFTQGIALTGMKA